MDGRGDHHAKWSTPDPAGQRWNVFSHAQKLARNKKKEKEEERKRGGGTP